MPTTYLDFQAAKAFLAKVAPTYKGRKDVALNAIAKGEQVTLFSQQWDGGSRYSYSLVNRENFTTMAMPEMTQNSALFTLPDNAVLITRTVFRGSELGVTVTAYSDQLPAQLATVSAGDSWNLADFVVLYMTKTRKASYAGMNRFEAFNDSKGMKGYDQPDMELTAWNAASDRLKAAKHLRKNGAITASGRNLFTELSSKFDEIYSQWNLWEAVVNHGYDWQGE